MNDYTTPASIIAITGTGKIGNQSLYKNDSNEAFLGEKFQFSNVLKSTVDSVEKTYSNAQNPKNPAQNPISTTNVKSDEGEISKPFDDDIVASHISSLEDAPASKSDVKFTKSNDDTHSNEQNNLSDGSKSSASADAGNQFTASSEQNAGEVFGENQDDITSNQNTNIAANVNQKPADAGKNKVTTTNTAPIDTVKGSSRPESGLEAPIINTAAKTSENKIIANNQNPESNGQSAARTSGEVLSSTALNKKTPEFSEDINKMAVKNTKDGMTASKILSANNPSKTNQEQDLSNRFKNNPNSRVKISVDNSSDKTNAKAIQNNVSQLNAAPSHAKAPTAQLAELSLEESQISITRSTNNRFSAIGDPKASTHHSISTNSNTTSQSQHANSLNNNQMLRQQAATIGAQQSATNQSVMGPKTPISVDIPGIAGTAGPNNQTQQVNKVAPPPPPPPPKPPVPIEQVAVQIKKAIGEGADKINIKLQPAKLGKVEVRMEIGKDGILTANVIAEKPETLELLQRDVRGLEKVLQEGGLKTDTQSFNFSLKQQGQQHATNQDSETVENSDSNEQNINPEDAEDSESTEASSSEDIIYGQNIATNGGVNIMI